MPRPNVTFLQQFPCEYTITDFYGSQIWSIQCFVSSAVEQHHPEEQKKSKQEVAINYYR